MDNPISYDRHMGLDQFDAEAQSRLVRLFGAERGAQPRDYEQIRGLLNANPEAAHNLAAKYGIQPSNTYTGDPDNPGELFEFLGTEKGKAEYAASKSGKAGGTPGKEIQQPKGKNTPLPMKAPMPPERPSDINDNDGIGVGTALAGAAGAGAAAYGAKKLWDRMSNRPIAETGVANDLVVSDPEKVRAANGAVALRNNTDVVAPDRISQAIDAEGVDYMSRSLPSMARQQLQGPAPVAALAAPAQALSAPVGPAEAPSARLTPEVIALAGSQGMSPEDLQRMLATGNVDFNQLRNTPLLNAQGVENPFDKAIDADKGNYDTPAAKRVSEAARRNNSETGKRNAAKSAKKALGKAATRALR